MKRENHYIKNQELILAIEDMTTEGEGIGKLDGFPFFVKDTIPGDRIRMIVTKVKKNYGYGRLKELLISSENRVEAPCPVARSCGGCRLQHLDYNGQLHFKQNQVLNCLKRIGGFEDASGKMEPIIGMDDPWHYRNKAQFPIGINKEGKAIAGFYAGRTHTIIPNTACMIQMPEAEEILEKILSYMDRYGIAPYQEKTQSGLVRHVLIRKGFHTGQLMVCLVCNGVPDDLTNRDELIELLRYIPGMSSIIFNVNTENTNRILGNRCITLWGKDNIEDTIDNIMFRISPLSFYQVNPVQTEKLYQKAMEYAALTGTETVWDMYCGIGTISLFLARKAKKVYGVEIVEQAILDARQNAAANGIDHVEFYVGKAEEVVPAWMEKTREKIDVVVLDPPRKGCDRELLATILSMQPERIVYVSCDPATLARDLKILCREDYRMEKWTAADMFPQTSHVECVCLLDKKVPDTYVKFGVDAEDYYRIKASEVAE